MLPTVNFFGHEISRLIVGGNPFSGHMYVPWISSDEVLDYYTADRIVETFFHAEELGYKTSLLLSDDFTLRVLRQYRNSGGKMNWIAQTHPPVMLKANLMGIMKQNPIAIFHQGTMTDNLVEAGKIEELKDNIKMIKETGKPTGISTHVPETIIRAEEENWGADFYMACVHNLRKYNRYQSSFITGKTLNHTFYKEDRQEMFNVIKKVEKPCIAFKILSGGHLAVTPETLEGAFRETYENIKPYDVAVVGIFQKYKDQLKENAEIVSRVLSELLV
ncbi:MAG: hypothetical protein HPY74_02815 [Firmicutes bacterium]|nr:hypothetical protein [Bacillota bacterium]